MLQTSRASFASAHRGIAGLCSSRASHTQTTSDRSHTRLTVLAAGTKGFGKLGAPLPGSTSPASPTQLHSAMTATAPADVHQGNAIDPAGCERLAALRHAMAQADSGRGVHAFIVPSDDPHMSEYPPTCFRRREFISKFTGTAGWCVITPDQALLWTDGRYFLQAGQQLGPQWKLMKAGMPGFPDMEDWLALHLPPGGRVGLDPCCHTLDAVRRLQRKLQEVGKEVVPLLEGLNLVDQAWGETRPPAPQAPLRVHPLQWAGEGVQAKVQGLQEGLAQSKADALLVTMLDEVAWLCNVRGSDVSCNPVALSYAMVRRQGPTTLYCNESKLPQPVMEHLQAAQVEVKPYSAFFEDVAREAAAGHTLCLDPGKVSYAVYQAAKQVAAASSNGTATGSPAAKKARVGTPAGAGAFVEVPSPVSAAKAVKNAAELSGMREAHLRDAVALTRFLSSLEAQVAGGAVVSEVEVDVQLTASRRAQPGFIEPSFPTIAGANGNGAIIHYRAQPGSCGSVDGSTLLLLDSGGQYECGTTDITRTMHFGTPTPYQARCYTRVLQGHIALDQAVFPEGTPGCAIDVLARLPLWRDGLNYRHGTGHGVGAALNVHEGPQSISLRFNNTTPLAANMICSNEPGYYEDGSFGIRIENLVVVKEVDTPHRFGGVPYFGFEYLTLVPMQAKMMDLALMSEAEVQWIDTYHAKVWEAVSPRLTGEEDVLAWLRRNTWPLREQQQASAA